MSYSVMSGVNRTKTYLKTYLKVILCNQSVPSSTNRNIKKLVYDTDRIVKETLNVSLETLNVSLETLNVSLETLNVSLETLNVSLETVDLCYINLFIFRFVSLLCLRSTLRLCLAFIFSLLVCILIEDPSLPLVSHVSSSGKY